MENEIHIYSDASERAIAAVAYLLTRTEDNNCQLGFILGKAKVAPQHGHTIPRLELCAAVLAVEVAGLVSEHLNYPSEKIRLYTDSKVVLGYIHNQTRRFYVYVSNRVDRIRQISSPDQWSYVPTDRNPADSATRCVPAAEIQSSSWLVGPTYLLRTPEKTDDSSSVTFPLVEPNIDENVRPVVKVLKSDISTRLSLGTDRFKKFSSWKRLVEALSLLKRVASSRHGDSICDGNHQFSVKSKTVETFKGTELFIIRTVQQEQFERELQCLRGKKPLPRDSKLLSLNPFIDKEDVLRVGGRLNKAEIPSNQRNPLILPAGHHISALLVQHHHDAVRHQGRHFTAGAVRAAGLWIIGGKRLISSVIHKCVKCRKLRGGQMFQQMADLPADRLQPGPPFTSVGVDTFGPWQIVTRSTRGGHANSKRWAVLFTCLVTRAVHIEVIEDLSSSSFINSLRRFIAIRGDVTTFRSDRGTNFVGATDVLKIDTVNVEQGTVKDFLYNNGCTWLFNPPHSSHMGGVWERMIGIARKILDSLLSEVEGRYLTHEVLTTFMAEVSAIMNSRPLTPVSSDPHCPQILTPSTLLTQQFGCEVQPLQNFDTKNVYKAQWQRIQVLADLFWARWKKEYLQSLQMRRKWQNVQIDLKMGDVVLMKDDQACRNDWPMGTVVNAISGDDGRVRAAEVRVVKDGRTTVYTRPVTQLVFLFNGEDDSV